MDSAKVNITFHIPSSSIIHRNKQAAKDQKTRKLNPNDKNVWLEASALPLGGLFRAGGALLSAETF